MIYQVFNWDEFENERSRVRETCSFVCVPNKQHGMGFIRVVSETDGAAIYGVWQMILGACSQQGSPRDGFLTSNGTAWGEPWGPKDLAMKFRRPEAEIQRALEFLCTDAIGWIVQVPPGYRPTTITPPPQSLRKKEVKEGKGSPPGSTGEKISGAERITRERELERVEDAMKKLKEKSPWTAAERERFADLKERKGEILEALGMMV